MRYKSNVYRGIRGLVEEEKKNYWNKNVRSGLNSINTSKDENKKKRFFFQSPEIRYEDLSAEEKEVVCEEVEQSFLVNEETALEFLTLLNPRLVKIGKEHKKVLTLESLKALQCLILKYI